MIALAATLAAALTVGSVHMSVSTSVAQAQSAFDRGLFLYYAYDGEDAVRAFTQAAELDPRLAMAYWGIALAEGPDLNTPIAPDRFEAAAAAARKAAAIDANASPVERRFIDAMLLRYKGKFAGWGSDDAAYRQAMQAIAEATHDENAELLAAEALLEHGGLAWRNGALETPESQQALRLVNAVLHDDPSNVMANHLCIHLYDLAPDRSPARLCAQRLDDAVLPPQGEHLAHMPAHYWIETGDYAAALRSSERAYALVERLAGDAESAHTERYVKHDVAVGYSAAMMLGSYVVAQRWSQRMSAAFGTGFDAVTALRFGRYQTAYADAQNGFFETSARGLAALHLGYAAQARALAKQIPSASARQGYLPQLFFARLAAADGNYVEAESWIDAARQNEHAAFSGELLPLVPADELLGTIRLAHGDVTGAIAAFNDALAAYPNDPRALFGLAEAQARRGDAAAAAATRARFTKEWTGADTSPSDVLP